MHSDDKEDYGKQDKPELGDIDVHDMHNREEEHIDHLDDGIKEKEGQTCQEFVFSPFQCKYYCNECDEDLKKSIKYHARLKECRDHFRDALRGNESEDVLNGWEYSRILRTGRTACRESRPHTH